MRSVWYSALVAFLFVFFYFSLWRSMQSLGILTVSALEARRAGVVLVNPEQDLPLIPSFSSGTPMALSAAFLRSCAELLAEGGVYIYPTDALAPSVALSPRHSALFPYSNGDWIDPLMQYSVEVALISALQGSPYITNDPASAKVFVVPQYATLETHSCLYATLPIPANRLRNCAANVSRDYLLPIIESVKTSPWYKKNNGSDHFWIFPWDESWDLFPGVPEALTSNHFFGYFGSPANLVAVPVTARFAGEPEDAERNLLLGGTSNRSYMAEGLRHPHAQRFCSTLPSHKYLASFAGTVWPSRKYSRGLRQDLLEKFPLDKAEQTGVAFIDKHMEVADYRQLLRESIFCLSPQGWTPWSQRLFFAISTGCIPVSVF